MKFLKKSVVICIILIILILSILLGETYLENLFGFELPKLYINEALVVDLKYIISGILFIFVSLIELYNNISIKKNCNVCIYNRIIDILISNVLINSILIILSSQGFIHSIIPVVIISTSIIINSIKYLMVNNGKLVSSFKIENLKNAFLTIGIILTLFYNLPFELLNISIAKVILFVSTVISIISCVQYYNLNKYLIFEKNK